MAGSRSLAAYPKSYPPVSPSEKATSISAAFRPHERTQKSGLGDYPQMIIKRQEESSRVSLCTMLGD
jgi:hypothetical protein